MSFEKTYERLRGAIEENANLRILATVARTTAIDLPQKPLVWENQDGRVFVTYNDPLYLRERDGVEGRDEILTAMSNALRSLAAVGMR